MRGERPRAQRVIAAGARPAGSLTPQTSVSRREFARERPIPQVLGETLGPVSTSLDHNSPLARGAPSSARRLPSRAVVVLPGLPQFFSNDSPDRRRVHGSGGAAEVLAEGFIDHRLVTAARGVRAVSERLEQVVVQVDGDARFAWLRDHRASLRLAEVAEGGWRGRPAFAMLRAATRPRVATARSDGVANRSSRETGRK